MDNFPSIINDSYQEVRIPISIDNMISRFYSWLRCFRGDRKGKIRVFVSYAHEDEQAVATLVSDLRSNDIEVWYAPDDLLPGDRLNSEIKKAISRVEYFLVAITPQSRNSQWVAKEIEYALHQKSDKLKIIPLYLTSREAPAQLSDLKGIDIQWHYYKVGFKELLDVLSGIMPKGRTPLSEFARYVDSLPVIDKAIQDSLDNLRREVIHRRKNRGLYPDASENKKVIQRIVDSCDTLLTEKHYDAQDKKRMLTAARRGDLFPAIQKDELSNISAWLRQGHPATLAVAARLYYERFVIMPSRKYFQKLTIKEQIRGWVARGQLPEEEAPSTEWLVNKLIDEGLIKPFRREEYLSEPNDDYQAFHWKGKLHSVGKAAYLYAQEDPERPHGGHWIWRWFPGRTK